MFNVRVFFNVTEVPFETPRITSIFSWDYPHGMYTIGGGQNTDPQSMGYPCGLFIWTTLKWTTPLKFSYFWLGNLVNQPLEFQVSFSSIMTLNGTGFTQFLNPNH